ncbi:MAG: hypothetical protein LW650_02735 [Planctomycetaceae bacterium]|jgi:hypothetical protein|nr:hypothetical protein [Phycisphaerales bacterium]MCE2652440.1 hypothetical protein [Planctomycetaceae bacterium]
MPNPSSSAAAATSPTADRLLVCHVTHEGIEQMGGIGTVLQGLITSPTYRAAVERDILIGPLPHADRSVNNPLERLGPFATECLYSGKDGHDPRGLGAILRPVEWAFGTPLVYGRRYFAMPGAEHDASLHVPADVLLVDVGHPDRARLGDTKFVLSERYGLDSRRYEHSWDFEEWVRMAGPTYHALAALMGHIGWRRPAVLIGHEFMGVPTALRCAADPARFRTLFHAHECSTGRRICEQLAGHDAAFYPAMRLAAKEGKFVTDVFGDQSDFARHELVRRTHRLDAVMAVGPETAEELRFLSSEMTAGPRAGLRVVYNGVPAAKLTPADKQRSRRMMNQWLEKVIGFVPDYVITHVTRPVPSKGLWRDAKLGARLEQHLAKAGKTAAYILLTCGAPVRSQEQVDAMAKAHGWPARHAEGWPDLDGPETGIYRTMMNFAQHAHEPVKGEKARATAITPILVNQFGWGRSRLGGACPEEMTFDDLRRATDVELGMSVYEPYGISPLEPLHAGAICVISSVSGCLGAVHAGLKDLGQSLGDCRNVIATDFTVLGEGFPDAGVTDGHRIHQLVAMSPAQRNAIEDRVCTAAADELFARLPRDDADRAKLLASGQALAQRLSWDAVVGRDLLPALRATTG